MTFVSMFSPSFSFCSFPGKGRHLLGPFSCYSPCLLTTLRSFLKLMHSTFSDLSGSCRNASVILNGALHPLQFTSLCVFTLPVPPPPQHSPSRHGPAQCLASLRSLDKCGLAGGLPLPFPEAALPQDRLRSQPPLLFLPCVPTSSTLQT